MESPKQVYLILAVSVALGAYFGFIFGVMDVEDARGWMLRQALLKEERYCFPVGAVLGGVSGFMNERLARRDEGYAFDPIAQNDFDDDDHF